MLYCCQAFPNYASIILSIIGSQEHNWLTGSIIGSWEPYVVYDTCVMELTYIGCVERLGVVVLWWLMGTLG